MKRFKIYTADNGSDTPDFVLDCIYDWRYVDTVDGQKMKRFSLPNGGYIDFSASACARVKSDSYIHVEAIDTPETERWMYEVYYGDDPNPLLITCNGRYQLRRDNQLHHVYVFPSISSGDVVIPTRAVESVKLRNKTESKPFQPTKVDVGVLHLDLTTVCKEMRDISKELRQIRAILAKQKS